MIYHDKLLERVMNHVSMLLNSADVETEIQKMIALEITTNPDNASLEYLELMHIVILRLAQFYNDDELEELWYNYLECDDDQDQAA